MLVLILITVIFILTINAYLNYKKKKVPILISVDGNIGVGKSTLVDVLKKELNNIDYLQEPVDIWLNLKDNEENILDKFYKDQRRWSYTFQNLAFITRMELIVDKILKSKKTFIISDRCMESDKNVFAKILRNDGYLSDIEWNMYNKWNNLYNKYFCINNRINIIYLRCDPEISYDRIKKRGRDEEKNITLEYLKKIHNAHEEWLLNNKDNNLNVLVLDCNNDFLQNHKLLKNFLYRIKGFMRDLTTPKSSSITNI
jgi:deoxyguanosine kinase